MAAIEAGKICVKIKGRKSGEKVKVLKVIDRNFVEIEYPSKKTKRCNVQHLEPLPA